MCVAKWSLVGKCPCPRGQDYTPNRVPMRLAGPDAAWKPNQPGCHCEGALATAAIQLECQMDCCVAPLLGNDNPRVDPIARKSVSELTAYGHF